MSFGNRSRYAAALQDCEELLFKLESIKGKVDFDAFAQVWRDNYFSLIFCGRTSEEELIEFTDDLFLAAKSCWLPPNNTTRRLLASYLIYGLYFKQPAKNACKFKVTKQEWREIAQYFNFVKNNNLPEHYYMFCKLIESDAFKFTATPYEINLDKRTRRADTVDNTVNTAGSAGVTNTLDKLVSTGFFENITTTETKYEEAKCQLFKAAPDLAAGLADIVTKDLGQKLRSMCIKRTLEQENDQGTGAAVPIEKEEAPETEEIGERRVASKQRPLGYESDKAEESAWSTEDDADDPDAVPQAKRRRRERGYHMVKNFRQRQEMRVVQGDDNYCFHSKSSRTLHNNPMHNFMAGKRPRRQFREKGDKPSLDYLCKGIEFAKAARRKLQDYRTLINTESMEQEEKDESVDFKKLNEKKEDSDNDVSFVITSQQNSADEKADDGSEIAGRMSMELGEEENTNKDHAIIPTEEKTKSEIASDVSNSSGSVLNMPMLY